LDDRAWTSRALLDVWRSPGFPDSGQMAWYRLRIGPEELADLETPAIRLGFVRNAYEIYVNGQYVGGAGALPPDPVVTHDRIQVLPLTGSGASAHADHMVIALRVWGGNDLSVRQTGGAPYADEFLLGNYSSLCGVHGRHPCRQVLLPRA
jgi:hypothetical protein